MADSEWKSYEDWLKQVPSCITQDPLWDSETYRKALFLSDLAWKDCGRLLKHPLGKILVPQLLRSAGSSPANIEEGYGRSFGKDYARFLRFALGSTRELRGWYYRNRHALEPEIVKHRMELATHIIGSLTITSNQQRRR